MKRSRFTKDQIAALLSEHEAGASVTDLASRYGVKESSIYNWKARYSGGDTSEGGRLQMLEEENAKLRKLLIDHLLETVDLAEGHPKRFAASTSKRETVKPELNTSTSDEPATNGPSAMHEQAY